MASNDKGLFEMAKGWVKENKLKTVAAVWASCLASSIAYNFSGPGKLSMKIIHARVHAQMLVLGGIAAGGLFEYYERQQRKDGDEQQQSRQKQLD